MKYIITELQARKLNKHKEKLKSLAYKYLDNEFRTLRLLNYAEMHMKLWVNSNDKKILQYHDDTNRLFVSREAWNRIKSFFSLDVYDMQRLIDKWVGNNLDIQNPLIFVMN